ncbi:MAG: hypothetical protein K2L95_00185 [Alphaproteobacteria bacterium]|nr:hypothetical protein [Alphaproteobacteria bacterium]MDE6570627.1 hypothetical protein [Alphaproteobacteria bacterium]
MKIKIIGIAALVVGHLVGTNANAVCNVMGLEPGMTCSSAGGKICNDGTCRMCCTEDSGGSGTALCGGTYTTDTSTTFSNYMGSGYIEKRKYTTSNCQCPSQVV